MEKLKVMTILGTRPEIIRLSEVIKCLRPVFPTMCWSIPARIGIIRLNQDVF